jgi:hypothetical protein
MVTELSSWSQAKRKEDARLENGTGQVGLWSWPYIPLSRHQSSLLALHRHRSSRKSKQILVSAPFQVVTPGLSDDVMEGL